MNEGFQTADVYRSALDFISRHGPHATVFAAFRADACALKGDDAGVDRWLRVIETIRELQDSCPRVPEGVLH